MSNYLDTRDLEGELSDLEARETCDNCAEPLTLAQDLTLVHAETGEGRCAPEDPEDTAEAEQSDPLDEEDREHLQALRDLRDEIGSEWLHGVTLIPESDFEEYARDFAEEIGAVPSNAPWPACHIDWEAAADCLQQDYTGVDFEGTEYLYR